jgi:hypothetical protein
MSLDPSLGNKQTGHFHWIDTGTPWFLLVAVIATPLKNMTSSVGNIIPNVWRNKNVTNHQPNGLYYQYNIITIN